MFLEATTQIDAATTLLMLESANMIDDRPKNQEESSNKQAEMVVTTADVCTQTEMTPCLKNSSGHFLNVFALSTALKFSVSDPVI